MIPRLVFQGQEVEATTSFLKDGIPIVSSDNSKYPFFQVVDPEQNFVVGGIGTYDDKYKIYKASFTMPLDAPFSHDDKQYIIEWEIVSDLGEKFNLRETFDVVNPDYDITDAKEQQKLTLSMIPMNVSIPVRRNVSSVEIGLFGNQSDTPIYKANAKLSSCFNEYYIYSHEIPANTLTGGEEYLLLWRYIDSHDIIAPQVIHCATIWEMQKISDLRMYLDKVAKRVDMYQGYRDSDLYFHLKRGVELLNTIGLITEYTLRDYQINFSAISKLSYWVLECAKYSALRAQYLAEGDSAFDFSSQPVTLTVDRTGFIESELGRIWDALNSTFKEAKNQIVKSSASVGRLNITLPTVSGYYQGITPRHSAILLQAWSRNFYW